MSVGEYCNREVVVTDADTSVADACRLMREFHVGTLVVVERAAGGPQPVGLITDRDVVLEVIALDLDPKMLAVTDIMTRELETVNEEVDFWDALSRMRSLGVRRMPVIDDRDRLVGIMTMDDALEIIGKGIVDLTSLIDREIRQERRSR